MGIISTMTPEVMRDSRTEAICASSRMDPPRTWNPKLSTNRTLHQPLTSLYVHLALFLNVRVRSFLTHMVVPTVWSWYLCPLLLETDQGGDPSHWVFSKSDWERFTELCRQDHWWYPPWSRPAHLIRRAHLRCCKRQYPRATTVTKCPTLGLTKNAWKCWYLCQIINLLWVLSDEGTCVCFCWVPSHCGIEGNEIVDHLAKETIDHDIDPLTTIHYADLKPLVNWYTQQKVKIKWAVSMHGRDLFIVKPTRGAPKKFRHLTRAEDVVITWLRIGYTKATKSHILSRGPAIAYKHCGQTIERMLLECTALQQSYYTGDSLGTLFKMIPEACIIEFLREAGLFYLVWMVTYTVQVYLNQSPPRKGWVPSILALAWLTARSLGLTA